MWHDCLGHRPSHSLTLPSYEEEGTDYQGELRRHAELGYTAAAGRNTPVFVLFLESVIEIFGGRVAPVLWSESADGRVARIRTNVEAPLEGADDIDLLLAIETDQR